MPPNPPPSHSQPTTQPIQPGPFPQPVRRPHPCTAPCSCSGRPRAAETFQLRTHVLPPPPPLLPSPRSSIHLAPPSPKHMSQLTRPPDMPTSSTPPPPPPPPPPSTLPFPPETATTTTTRVHISPIDRAIITRLCAALVGIELRHASSRPAVGSCECGAAAAAGGVSKRCRGVRGDVAEQCWALVRDPEEARRRVLREMGIEVLPALLPSRESEMALEDEGEGMECDGC